MGGIISFTGHSGAGKTSIITGLVETMPGLRFVPSYTTRSPRPSDFPSEFRHVSLREFEEIDKRGEFLWSVEAHGNRYGTRKADVDEATFLFQLLCHDAGSSSSRPAVFIHERESNPVFYSSAQRRDFASSLDRTRRDTRDDCTTD